ncbi:MAG: lysophospholipid acyltransferase family protein [candidate division Zixibacteria bacterium]|nr:lysophospholipid acyltransferase family protein [candidate division Zixibacteria bacterium]
MRLSKRLKRGSIYYLARFVIVILNVVSRRIAQAVGAWIGLLVWRLSGHDRYRINRHLSLVYGDSITASDRARIGRDFFIGSGKNLADVFRFQQHFPDEFKPLVTVEGLDYYRTALEKGNGVIGITGHIGNFELLGAHISSLGFPVAVIARELYDRHLDKLLVANRKAVGLTYFSTTESPRKVLRWLENKGTIGVLIDTDSYRVRGDFVSWFGRPAYTPIGQTLLGLKAKAAFVPMACVRTDENRYRIIIRPEINILPTGNIDDDVRSVTQACVLELEKIINQYRSQWIWLHNRWHTNPEKTA